MSEAHRAVHTFYVATGGDDRWSGELPEANADRTDGPFATITRARDAVRDLKRRAALRGPVSVLLRGGRYALSAPLRFTPDDSAPVTYAAYPGEVPVIDGGVSLRGWQPARVNGIAAWVTGVPHLPRPPGREGRARRRAQSALTFRQLLVDGHRRPRARLPKRDFYWIAGVPDTPFTAQLFDGTDTFVCAPGDVQEWRNLRDVEAVVLHYWIEERLPIDSFDAATHTVRLARPSVFSLKDDFRQRYARYYVENVFEALTEPGEWYLDASDGKVYYVPESGEAPDAIDAVAPVLERLLVLAGDPARNAFVEYLRFEGLTFRHTDWRQPREAYEGDERVSVPREDPVEWAPSAQAACNAPGAISMEGARHCALENCTVERVGGYAVEIGAGCRGVRVVGCTIRDTGAGGVKLWGASANGPRERRTGECRVTDNHIHTGGRVFHSAVGILAQHAFGNVIAHNHIHDLYYTGISCGWLWGYAENVSRDNRIEGNHIHHLGQGLLSDMGGIYTLGVQPGTVVRGNLIHDVQKHNYGGWGIYLDEGSSHILVEGNVCYRTSSQGFNQHYGRENVVRHNVFAFGGEGQTSLTRPEPHISFTLERNLLIGDGHPAFIGRRLADLGQPGQNAGFTSNLNLIWDTAWAGCADSDQWVVAANGRTDAQARWTIERTFTLAEWRALGHDPHSTIADPGCTALSPDEPDFRFGAGSPAAALGIRPPDLSRVGPRPPDLRD